jgi:signal transduction histidine kinase
MTRQAILVARVASAVAFVARAVSAAAAGACRIRALPLLVGGGVLVCAFGLWAGVRDVIAGHVDQAVSDRAQLLRATMLERTAAHEMPLRRLAFVIGRYGEPTERAWDEDVKRLIATDGFRRIRWIDSSLTVRRVVSRARDAVSTLATRVTDRDELAAIRTAGATGRSASTNPIAVGPGTVGRMTFVPIVQDASVVGYVAGDMDIATWLAKTIGRKDSEGFSVELLDGTRVLATRGAPRDRADARWHSEIGLDQETARWRISVAPTDHLVAEQRLFLADLVMIAGVIVALALASAVRTAQRAGWRAAEHMRSTRRLEREISERERAQQALHERDEQLRQSQKMEAIGRLAGGIAHDFNNLLTAISGHADFLLADIDRSDPRRDDAREIKKAATRAAALTGQLLAFSRRQIRQPKSLDLNTVISDLQKMLARLISEDIRVAMQLDEHLGTVHADPAQIEQVLLNLVVNASDAMPNGGTLSIATRNAQLDETHASRLGLSTGRYVILRVSDTGCGMDAATQARIFEPFFTTKEKGRGTGLGLSMVYAIVTSHGGMVTVDSTPEHGSIFMIYLPRHRAPAEAYTSGVYMQVAPNGTETVLLAEDEEGVRALTVRILERHGYTVLDAPNGRLALEVAAQHNGPIHLLLTDVVMPEIGGKQLADTLLSRRAEAQVLYISGYTDGEISRRGELNPDTAFLQKPFTAPALLAKVRDVLDRKSSPSPTPVSSDLITS